MLQQHLCNSKLNHKLIYTGPGTGGFISNSLTNKLPVKITLAVMTAIALLFRYADFVTILGGLVVRNAAEKLDEVAPALEAAKAEKGPAVVCLRTDRDANLATPSDPLMRFVEVYAGPTG